MLASLWWSLVRLTIEPLTNIADELTLQEVQTNVLLRNNQYVLLSPSLAFGGFNIHGVGLHTPKGRWIVRLGNVH
jgi:predicted pyridoxine 5'-phosphate oxidase superfamily flavin-nucleotide-binding protein